MPRLLSQCTNDVERQQLRHQRVERSRNRLKARGYNLADLHASYRNNTMCEPSRPATTTWHPAQGPDGGRAG